MKRKAAKGNSMEHLENNKENCQTSERLSKLSDSLKAYFEVREELIKKYGAKLSEWKIQ